MKTVRHAQVVAMAFALATIILTGLRATFRYTVTAGQLALEETATGNGEQAGGTTLEGSCAMEVSIALTFVEYEPRVAYSMGNKQLSLSAGGYRLTLIRTQGPPPGEPIAAPTPLHTASSPGSALDAGAPNTVGPLGPSTPLASGSRASC
jgi:hypothetical protein